MWKKYVVCGTDCLMCSPLVFGNPLTWGHAGDGFGEGIDVVRAGAGAELMFGIAAVRHFRRHVRAVGAGADKAYKFFKSSHYSGSVQFRTGGDMRIHLQQVQFFLVAFFVHRGDQHAAGFDAHHCPRRQVQDGDAGLAHEFFGFVERVDPAQDRALRTGTVVKREL